MAEITALNKYPCAACGAEAVWDPTKRSLVCPYCGTASAAELLADGSGILEHDLMAALRTLPEEGRAWEQDRVPVQCQSCRAISLFAADRVAQRCEFCGSSAVVPYTETRSPIFPESLLPFQVDTSKVRDSVREWYGSHWFAPSKLKRAAYTDTLHGLYIPYWTFDAQAHAEWSADAGYYYYETETFRGSDGRTQTRRVRKTRWEPASGSLDHFFNDTPVPATRGVNLELLRKVEPFPTEHLVPYDRGYVSGWVVEQYQIDLGAAATASEQAMLKSLEVLCAREIPGDTHRNLQVQPDFTARTFKHLLVPVWILSYNYGTKAYQVVVNGWSGQIAGNYPLSWIKVTLAVLAALTAVLLLLWLSSQQ